MAELYDPFSFSIQADPYPVYRILRERYPLYRNPTRGFWALSRFADVQEASRDWTTFLSGRPGVELDDSGEIFGPGNFLNSDPPTHDHLRNVVRGTFTPKSIARRESEIEGHVDRLIARLVDRGEGDLARDLAWPLPIAMVSQILGFPQSDHELLEGWVHRVNEREPDQARMPRRAWQAAREMRQYFCDQIASRRRVPRLDLLTEITRAEVEGRRLPEATAAGMCFILYLAGTETTASLVSNSLLLLHEHPDLRRQLAGNPSLLPQAIEEFLRYESPIQNLARTSTRDVTIHDEVIPAGERVLLLFGSANRDEQRYERPEVLEITRDAKRHLAFGEGIHFCLGAPLARLEAQVALRAVLRSIPDYEISGPVQRLRAHTTRGLIGLPVSVHSQEDDRTKVHYR